MKKRIYDIYHNSSTSYKYVLYSAHDTQVSNVLLFFNFSKFHYLGIPFDSSLIFELYYKIDCMEENRDDCFYIRITYNGGWMAIESCIENNRANNIDSYDCRLDDFLNYYDSISSKGDLDQLCYN